MLFKLQNFKNCLEDIRAALHFSEKPYQEYLLLDRKAKCHSNLGQIEKAKLIFGKAKLACQKAKLDQRLTDVFVARINKELEMLSTVEDSPVENDNKTWLKQAGNQFVTLSSSAKVITLPLIL